MASRLSELLNFPGAQALQNLHPLVVHFPIALLTTSALIYPLAWGAGRESWAWTGLWMLGLGTLGAALAVWTGLNAGQSVMVAQSVRGRILVQHRDVMLAVFATSVLLFSWAIVARPMPRRGRGAFIAMLLAMVLLLAKGADFGAWMVYAYNAGGSLPQPIELSQ